MGSSATISAGSFASARAIAARCCWPPDSAAGSLSAWSAMSRRESSARARGAALAAREGRAEVHRQHHVLGDGERGQQLEELEHDADAAPAPRRERVLRQRVQRLAVDDDRALGRLLDAGEQVDQRRLAAARRSDDGDAFAGVHVQVDAIQRAELAGGGGVAAGRAAQADEGRGGSGFEGMGGRVAMWREAEHTVQHPRGTRTARAPSFTTEQIALALFDIRLAAVTVETPIDRRAARTRDLLLTRCPA